MSFLYFAFKLVTVQSASHVQAFFRTHAMRLGIKFPVAMLRILGLDMLIGRVVPVFAEGTTLDLVSVEFKGCHHYKSPFPYVRISLKTPAAGLLPHIWRSQLPYSQTVSGEPRIPPGYSGAALL